MNRRKKILIRAVVALMALIPLVILTMHFRAKWRLGLYKKQQIAVGEKLAISELIPKRNATSNSLALLVKAAKAPIEGPPAPTPMQLSAQGPARVAWRQPKIWAFFFEQPPTNIWPLLQREVENNKETLSRYRELLTRSTIYFEPDYNRGFETDLGPLRGIRRIAQELSVAAMVSLHQGRKEEALENIRAILAVERVFENVPNITCQLSRSWIVNLSFSLCWEALQFPDWTDDELGQLQRDWETVDLLKQLEPSIAMERANIEREFKKIHEGPLSEPVEQCLCGDCVRKPREMPSLYLWKWIWSYDEEMELLKFYQNQLRLVRANSAQKTFTEDPTLWKHDWTRRIISFLAPPVQRFCGKQLCSQTEIEMVITVIALTRFQLAEGRHPRTLHELTPKYLEREPMDFCDGNQLRYQLNEDGTFLLYSVGRNGIDDGGIMEIKVPVRDFRDRLDMVWPKPQADAEVQIEEGKKMDFRYQQQQRKFPQPAINSERKRVER